MKQLIQDFKTGEIKIVDVPTPRARAGHVLVRNAWSLVSAGTERSTVSTGQKSLIGKARARPDLVKKVIDSARKEGIVAAWQKVQTRLDNWKTLGYSTAGVMIEVGEGVEGFQVGDQVACGGQDKASHADYVVVPANLCARVPDGVELKHACFTTVGVIALQGVRQADVKLGERVAVIGLGLVGQLTVQLLKAAGCKVLGIDVNPAACELALQSGADRVANRTIDDVEAISAAMTDGFGVDAILITAAASTNDPVELAARIARDRATVVMVGVTGMDLPRDLYFAKDLQFRLSRSYGPGRYDALYEEAGVDYPIGYVRWTEGRNFEAFLDLLAAKRLNLDLLTTHAFKIDDALKAYDVITGKTGERFLAVLIEYPDAASRMQRSIAVGTVGTGSTSGKVVLGVIGAGNYAQAMLLPHLKGRTDVELAAVATSSGVTARKVAERSGFAIAATDPDEIINNDRINAVIIATRHHLHAKYVLAALAKGKAVFVEKPLVMNRGELEQVALALADASARVQVGFNRRFAPTAIAAREFMQSAATQTMIYRVNAGPLPANHWTRDPEQGGGRLIGEGCHFIDFLIYLAGSLPERVHARGLGGGAQDASDSWILDMGFQNGSIGSILYTATGDPAFPKERVESFGAGRVAVIDDFKTGFVMSGGNRKSIGSSSQDKGQAPQVGAFLDMVAKRTPMPIPRDQLLAGASTMFGALESMREGREIEVRW
ncbi:MAG: bi-domain-containing oxidoreductase [Candidatus Eisenbacteria bacterium]|nr:bi-domain-containing oxidoreductase [Candidatus Eisenbacteria bacterium]